MSSEIAKAIKQICDEKNIPVESVIETIEAAMAVAYRKDFGTKNQNIVVNFDGDTGEYEVFDEKTVVEKGPEPEEDETEAADKADGKKPGAGDKKANKADEGDAGKSVIKPATAKDAAKDEVTRKKGVATGKEGGEQASEDSTDTEEDEEPKFNPKTDITLEDAQAMDKKYNIGDVIRTKLEVPSEFGRMAAQTAKQVIIQKLREAERENLFNEYQEKIGHIVSGMVQRVEGRVVLVDLGHAIAVMPPQQQIRGEMYSPGQRVKVFLVSVDKTNKGPEIIASRAHPEMVRELFESEVPEISSGAIEVKSIAREAGSRTKIAVMSNQDNIDPIGSCVGQRGTRVQTIINELGGEKIDIVEWSDDPVRFIINALSPAKVISVKLDEQSRGAVAEVKEDQLSLAIGKAGQNVRLAAQLTGWRIDVVKEGEDVSEKRKAREEQAAAKEKAARKGAENAPADEEAAPVGSEGAAAEAKEATTDNVEADSDAGESASTDSKAPGSDAATDDKTDTDTASDEKTAITGAPETDTKQDSDKNAEPKA